jgi:CRP-like cAMP-binding protein
MTDVSQKISNFFTTYPLRTFEKRQILLRPDDMLPSVFYITEGRVSQYDITPTGNEVVVNVFKPGVFFPMSWAINKTPNHYFFEASTPVSAHVVPADDAVQFLKDNPDVTFDLLARVYRGVDGVLRRMAHLMGGDARSRLLYELLNAANRFGESQKDGSVLVPLKEGDLARHSGLARETVNRTMQSLKTAELIDVTQNGIAIKDMSQIDKILGSAL